ncbi:MAG: 6-hydroxypseudooxynicotine dehydrogenase complex subunit beta [Alphaproteobacteria bacterium MarineAlpha5_Bin9]|nr:MAG: 6-hydroxypseudooxynicotine dehydrogenase complex subunit beta [Alphaproteobacteria bacterium MarineAlpha5_Bin9]|tara:strand:+ start:161 stop:1600 length:1440 start_codon:yes stop_codon:yes gene_type:complete
MSSKIKFVYNNNIIELENIDPNETLLNFIRNNLKKTGTKEGCAEGGCGACTVVLGTLKNNKILYQVVNSCIIFVPMIHGKQLIIVEDLESKKDLHPVQKAMIKHNGSQCGFCTPGFVMSLFSMYKNNNNYTEKIIKDSISGNLCRCTGYKPIINAGKELNNYFKPDKFEINKKIDIELIKKIQNEKKPIKINYNNKLYFSPLSIKELLLIIKNNPNAKLINGGTDLALTVTKSRKDLNSLIYLGNIKELNYIKENQNNIEIGSSTPLIEIEKFISKYYSDFSEILKRYGSYQIRNIATIGGNLGTASPIGDTLPILLSLNALIITQKNNISRKILIKDFFTGYRKTKLKKNEFIKAIIIPKNKSYIFRAYKISKRYDDDISSVCMGINLNLERNIIRNIIIAYGGMSEKPKRATNCEKYLNNKNFDKETIIKSQKELLKDFNPINDMRASSEYRKNIAKNLLLKFFFEIKKNKNIRIYD